MNASLMKGTFISAFEVVPLLEPGLQRDGATLGTPQSHLPKAGLECLPPMELDIR